MKKAEIAKTFRLTQEEVEYYEKQGLLTAEILKQDKEEAKEALAKRLCLLKTLEQSGVPVEGQRCYLQLLAQGHSTCQERMKMLKLFRTAILADLHVRQKNLDDLDYLIYSLRQRKEIKK